MNTPAATNPTSGAKARLCSPSVRVLPSAMRPTTHAPSPAGSQPMPMTSAEAKPTLPGHASWASTIVTGNDAPIISPTSSTAAICGAPTVRKSSQWPAVIMTRLTPMTGRRPKRSDSAPPNRLPMLTATMNSVSAAPATANDAPAAIGSAAALAAIIVVVGARSYFQQALMTYLPEWLRGNGQSLAVAGAALTLFMVAVSVGSLFGGALSDRFGRLPVIGVSLALMMAGHWLLLHSIGTPQMAAVLLIGLMIGASFPVTIVLAQEAWPRSLGFASAMVMGLGWLPAGLGAWAVGRIADGSTLTDGLRSLTLAPLVGLTAAGVFWVVGKRRGTQSHSV